MTLSSFVDKIFCINLDSRPDRWFESTNEFKKLGINQYERFSGCVVEGMGIAGGNAGCTKSHRTIFKLIEHSNWDNVLVFEDDFLAIPPNWEQPNNHAILNTVIREGRSFDFNLNVFNQELDLSLSLVPKDFDIIYLGGGYGSDPIARINKRCIRVNTMMTTSSYIITKKFAKYLSDELNKTCIESHKVPPDATDAELLHCHLGPVDSCFSAYLPQSKAYCIQPRMFVQRPSYSDLTYKYEHNHHSMMDKGHESRI